MISTDIVCHVFHHLFLHDLLECSRVSKCWRELAHQEIQIRTRQKVSDIIAKHKTNNRSLVEKLIWTNRKNLSVSQLFKKMRFAAILKFDGRHMFADDVDVYPSFFLSLRWISLPNEASELKHLHQFSWSLTNPIIISAESKNKKYRPRIGTVSSGKRKLLTETDVPKDLQPVVIDRLISLYNVGNTVVAVWNDISTIAFLVHAVPLTSKLFADSLYLQNPAITKACNKALELDSFGITAIVTLRNFKKVFFHEIFSNLFYNEGGKVIFGIDESILYNLTLDKDFALLWKTENFKGKILHCAIVDVVLKHSKCYNADNLWDVSKYNISQLCNLKPITEEFYNTITIDFAADDCYLLSCSNDFLSVDIILSFCVQRDIYIVNKIILKRV